MTICTAISLLTFLGWLSRIRGKPITAINTKAAAPIKRWRARCRSGSSNKTSSSWLSADLVSRFPTCRRIPIEGSERARAEFEAESSRRKSFEKRFMDQCARLFR